MTIESNTPGSKPTPQAGRFKLFLICLLAGLVAGCASTGQPGSSRDGQNTRPSDQRSANTQESENSGLVFEQSDAESGEPESRYELFEGDGQFINNEAASRRPVRASEDGEVILNFEGESLQEVVKLILGDMLQEGYVISPGVSGNVTFATSEPITYDEVLPILDMLLSWNNAAMVYLENRWHVVPIDQAIPGQLTITTAPLSGQRGYEVRAFMLDYIAPTEMEKLLQPYARPNATISVDNTRNMLVMAGTRQELENYKKTIDIFDVDWLKGMSVGIYPIERVEADTVVTELEAVFGDASGTPLAGMFRFMAIERLNAVLVITPQVEYLRKAEEWVQRLDRGGGEAGVRLYVYPVKHVKAVDLADTLSSVFGGGSSSGSSQRSSSANTFAPGLETGEITSINDRRRRVQEQQQQQNTASNTSQNSGVSLAGGDDINITAVEESNSLLIRATPSQYDSVESAIKRLDTMPLQVLIEVSILEVVLNDSLAYGVEWFLETAINDFALQPPGSPSIGGSSGSAVTSARSLSGVTSKGLFDSSGDISAFRSGTIGSDGLSYLIRGADIGAVVTALDTTTDVKTIAAPSMVVLNNREANINVGDQIPVNSPVFNTGTGSNLSTSRVQFRDTGVILNVVPRVNPGGMVFMEVQQEFSQPSSEPDPNGNVSIARRSIDTEIAVQSGETVVLGGLIRAFDSKGSRGVPGLSRIPLIGGLFGRKSNTSQRTELLVTITPTVISNPQEAAEVTEEYRNKLKEIKPIYEQSLNIGSQQ